MAPPISLITTPRQTSIRRLYCPVCVDSPLFFSIESLSLHLDTEHFNKLHADTGAKVLQTTTRGIENATKAIIDLEIARTDQLRRQRNSLQPVKGVTVEVVETRHEVPRRADVVEAAQAAVLEDRCQGLSDRLRDVEGQLQNCIGQRTDLEKDIYRLCSWIQTTSVRQTDARARIETFLDSLLTDFYGPQSPVQKRDSNESLVL